jgi:hypothetical protein
MWVVFLIQHLSVHAENLSELSANPFNPDSTSNPFGAESPFKPDGLNNPFSPFGRFGSPYSPDSINNPFGAWILYNPNSPTNLCGHVSTAVSLDIQAAA